MENDKLILFGHVGLTASAGKALKLPIIYLLFASMLPDVVDKVLFAARVAPSTRFIGHTIIFSLAVSFLFYIITKKKNIGLALLLGCLLHLLGDITGFLPLFYPFVNYAFPSGQLALRIGPFEIITESLGIILLVIIFKSKIRGIIKKITTRIDK